MSKTARKTQVLSIHCEQSVILLALLLDKNANTKTANKHYQLHQQVCFLPSASHVGQMPSNIARKLQDKTLKK